MDDRDADVHNFSPTQHRLPTVSGIEALQNATANARGISSCLPALDAALLPSELSIATPGLQRGVVTEVYGPPGVGKTTFGLQVAVNALHTPHDQSHVLWVNTGSPLIQARLGQLMKGDELSNNSSKDTPPTRNINSLLNEKFTYLEAHTLPRLLTVFLHPTRSLPSPKTCLIVVDDLSNLLLGYFSRNARNLKPAAPVAVKEKLEKRAAGRRFQIIESLGAAMSKMAAIKNIAVLVLTNSTISLKHGQKATLKPALSSQAWDTAVHTRIILYRDFPNDKQASRISRFETNALRYAEVQRLARKEVYAQPVPFVILTGGFRQLTLPGSKDDHQDAVETNSEEQRPTTVNLPLLPDELSQPSHVKKRKAVEIADSEEEEDEDEDIKEVPPTEHDAPEFPANHLREQRSPQNEEEMILDAHETAMLRASRYASIRGSEDAIPEPSSESESEEEIGDSEEVSDSDEVEEDRE
ncbi:P-loop containing nucleoside triphosphate hydrolase protein [Exophiala viscosa]|uniref:P-loop containing nucleoside triphosphate hydrolase protein n=1 Tax=Exophiala viscosa TaxID=2486360 RepID=UPI00218D02CE|nr:P-loop containing nucleoside triphosphate hydrolase protein [Exophiala viscosa]